ncbi:MAG: STAS domain-containing protein [Burkholderiales bacterium]|nr:STAS domain-containing protein [Burkholderiales bacterium]
MEVSAERRENTGVVAVRGRIDHLNATAFHDALKPYLEGCRDGNGLVLDLSGLDYISSAGLRIFMIAAKQVRTGNGRIAVAQMQPLVREIFEISHFHLVYEIFSTLDEGVAALGRAVEITAA